MKHVIDILIPTWNNPEYLNPCVQSIIDTGVLDGYARLFIINNGKQPIREQFGHVHGITVLEPGENLGWEGGLEFGLKHSTAPFVCFQNDDTFIPKASWMFYERLLIPFQDRSVGAVGPVTTVAAGRQSVFNPGCPRVSTEVSYLIFFTVMLRRETLDKVGGIDTTLPGGDDLDLSIRLRKAGYHIIINPDAFLIHHAFKTGERVRGGPHVKGGWNSVEMSERTNRALIQKHGFRAFFDMLRGLDYSSQTAVVPADLEGEVVKSYLNGSVKVLELGCGAKKTVPYSTGVDIIPLGEKIPNLLGAVSIADVVADITKPLPFLQESYDAVIARHVIEHCVDTVDVIQNWSKSLRVGGKLIIAAPDEQVTNGIPLNPEHCHAFTQTSLRRILERCGFRETESKQVENGVSFVACYEKLPVLVEASCPSAWVEGVTNA